MMCGVRLPLIFLVLSVALEAQRPPAVPLVANDPYFSIWSMSDRLNTDMTRHWTGKPQALTSLARIDGKTVRLMGGPADPNDHTPAAAQAGYSVRPTQTSYRFEESGVEIAIFDDNDQPLAVDEVGEIVVRGDNVMLGYLNQPEATAEVMKSGWYHTGDLGKIDSDGYVFIVDRKKDMVITSGLNVYPREIEEVLYEHPAVAVTLRRDADVTVEQLREFVKRRVAAYEYPCERWLADEPPKGPTGKILRREVAIPAGVRGGC